MTVEFDLLTKIKAVTGGAMQSFAPRAIDDLQVITYDSLAEPRPAQTLNPDQITEQDVIKEQDFPVVNQSVFGFEWDPAQPPMIVPWLICGTKRAERDINNRLLFRVTAEFRSGNKFSLAEEDLEPIDAPAGVDQLPFIVETIWGENERVIYEEPDNNQPLRLPTGSYYSESFKRRFPQRTKRQTQFEDIAVVDVDNIIEQRLFTVQGSSFAGDPAIPPRWMITGIEYQPVLVPNFNNVVYQAMMMTYTITRNSEDGGWFDRRALVDNFILTTGGDLTTKEPYRDPTDGSTIIDALLNQDGSLADDQTANNPFFRDYQVQPTLDWSFLK